MINLIIQDGLGNQMFQYAFARLLAEEYKKKDGAEEGISIVTSYMDRKQDGGNTWRSLALDHLRLNGNVRFPSAEEQSRVMRGFKWRTLLSSGIKELFNWRVRRIFKSTDALAERRGKSGLYYPYGPHTNHAITLSEKSEKYVFGFFQTAEYANRIREILMEEFMVKEEPSEKNVRMIDEISNCESVCVHIRRGDYLNARWKNLQVCDFEYYNKAMNEVMRKVANPVFFIFSNTHKDLEWIRENYHFQDEASGKAIEVRYVDLSNPDYEELRLMYHCKHFIISNSTFSWWGAWLSRNYEKIVCVPSRWNLDFETDRLIYDKQWTIIK